MARPTTKLTPIAKAALDRLGDRLRLARQRRGLTAAMVAERAGLTPFTLRRVERGEPGVTIGAYIAVIHVLGLTAEIDAVAREDQLGRQIQDAALTSRPRRRKSPLGNGPNEIPQPRRRGPRDRISASSADAPLSTPAAKESADLPVRPQDLLHLIDPPSPAAT
jgi:transcriptional regulator with XRE-family HTH domain